MGKTLRYFLGIFITVVIFGLVAVGLIVIKLPYTGSVVYTEKEPYTDESCKNVEIKAIVEYGDSDRICINEICDQHEQYCTDKNWLGNCVQFEERCTHYACTKYQMDCSVEIQNIDDEKGSWGIRAYSIEASTRDKNFIMDFYVDVQPTRTSIGRWQFTYEPGEVLYCYYEVTKTPTKSVCENTIQYRDVGKTKEQIMYCNAWKKIVGKC